MVVDSILPQAECGPNDHRKDAPSFNRNLGYFKFSSVKIGDISAALACPLCQGYIIDAISLDSCGHAFCRGCILRHAQDSKLCPGK